MRRELRYKGVRVNQFGIPKFLIGENIETNNTSKRKFNQHKLFHHNFKHNKPRNQILIYNIPNTMRKERDWLRRHLKKFDYLMIQKNVWIGPSPLPTDFLSYAKSIKLLEKITILKLLGPYTKK